MRYRPFVSAEAMLEGLRRQADETASTMPQGIPAGGTTGQALKKVSGTDYDVSWQDDATGGGGGSSVKLTQATGNLASASFDDVEADLPWNAPAIANADVTISGADITIDADGTYKFTVTLRTDNTNRTELFIRTYIDTGSGYAQDTAATVSDYVSRDGDQDTGAVTLIYAFSLTDGDRVKFAGFGDTDGASTGVDDGTVLIIEQY